MRDQLRGRVYAAESQVRAAVERAAAGGGVDFFGSMLPVPQERRFSDFAEVASYIAGVLVDERLRGAFGAIDAPGLRARAGEAEAHYEFDTAVIALPQGGGWAWRELVILHELAHHITALVHPEAASHGPEFASVYCRLVEWQLGGAASLLLRAALDGEGVVVGGTG
jgi:putative metallohydrolase (TIGR04338 family)